MSERHIVPALKAAGLTEVNLTYDALNLSAELLGCEWPFVPLGVYDKGERIILLAHDSDERRIAKELVDRIVDSIRGNSFLHINAIGNSIPNFSRRHQELLGKIITHSPLYEWLDEVEGTFWRPPTSPLGQSNRILSICRRLYSVTETIPLERIVIAVGRALKSGLSVEAAIANTPSVSTLAGMLTQTELFDVVSSEAIRVSDNPFRELNNSDLAILRAGEGLGRNVNFTDICHNAVKEGLTLGAAQVEVTAYSPFLYPVSRGYYRFLVNVDELDLERLSTVPTERANRRDLDNEQEEEDLYEEFFFEVDARALLSGKSTLSDPTSTKQEWDVLAETGEMLGRCIIEHQRISQVRDILEKMAASPGDLISVSLETRRGVAQFRVHHGGQM